MSSTPINSCETLDGVLNDVISFSFGSLFVFHSFFFTFQAHRFCLSTNTESSPNRSINTRIESSAGSKGGVGGLMFPFVTIVVIFFLLLLFHRYVLLLALG